MKRAMIALPIMAVGALATAGLAGYSAFAARPVSYWVAHQDILRQKLAWCHDHPGDGGAECTNAQHAELHLYNQALLAQLRTRRH